MKREATNALRFPEATYGTWQSDHDRTLSELKRNLRPGHPKIRDYDAPESRFPLTIIKKPGWVVYEYRGERVRARHQILCFDEFTVVTKVQTTWLNDQALWHLHYISENCYWVTVDLDWGFIYREFFIKISPRTTTDEDGVGSISQPG